MADALISVAGVTVVPGVKCNIVRWTMDELSCLPYLGVDKFEIWSATSNNRTLASKVGESKDLSWTHEGLLIGLTRYYWVRAKDTSNTGTPQYSDFSPVSATSGVAGTPTSTGTNSVGSDELADNSVGGNHLKADSVTASKISVTSLDAISATLGNVAINGSLVVNGTISANKYADLSVGTGKVANNAITNADAALTTGTVTIGSELSGEIGLQTLGFNASSGQTLLSFNCAVTHGGSASQTCTFRIKKGSSTKRTISYPIYANSLNLISLNWIDDDPSNATWSVTGARISRPGDMDFFNRYLECLNTKK